MTLFRSLFRRLISAWPWLLAQLFGTLALLLLGLAWTRLSEKNFLLVAATLLLPILLAAAFLFLEAGTLRAFLRPSGESAEPRAPFAWATASLVGWILLFLVFWALLDHYDAHILSWASYLNSKATDRTHLFTFEHISLWLTVAEWLLRWIALPALLLPFAAASAQSAWRIPWRKTLRFLLNWKWGSAIILMALLGVFLPSHFFNAPPSGSVHAQEWHVGLKLAATYLLALSSWILTLAWLAVLFSGNQSPSADGKTSAIDQALN